MKFAEFAGVATRIQLSNDYSAGKSGGWVFRARKVSQDGTVLKELRLLTYLDPETELEVLEGGFLDANFNTISKNGKMIVRKGEKVDMSEYGEIKS